LIETMKLLLGFTTFCWAMSLRIIIETLDTTFIAVRIAAGETAPSWSV